MIATSQPLARPFRLAAAPPRRPALCRALALLIALSPGGIRAGGPGFAGAWNGTIGRQAVSVCFDTVGSSYYYHARLRGIPLREDGKGRLLEGHADDPVTGIWTLETPARGRLHGRWSDPAGRRTLPIELARVAAPTAAGDGCAPAGDEAAPGPVAAQYRAARVAAARRTTRAARFGGKPYLEVTSVGGVGLSLPEASKAIAAVNAFAGRWLERQTGDAYDCDLGLRAALRNGDLEWRRALKPVYWSGRWLSLSDTLPDTFCGGPHGVSGVRFHTFDLLSGERVDPAGWFREDIGGSHGENVRGARGLIREALRAALAAEGYDDAFDACGTGYSVRTYLGGAGMVFHLSYAHAQRACDRDLSIPYARLLPFLTRAGGEQARALMQGVP